MQSLVEKLTKIPLKQGQRRKPSVVYSLPESAGVYVFFKDGLPIYVGKAINLKRRVGSYFDLDLEVKTDRMVKEATDLSFIQVASELEALLLEARLIRKYMPHYNIEAKDDKHPLYIVITKEKYPRVTTVRKIDLNKSFSSSFGPFPAGGTVRSVLKMIRRIFPFSDHKLGKRGCLYSHIGLCDPCPSEILNIKNLKLKIQAGQKYKKNIRNIKKILDGKVNNLQRDLEKTMANLSKQQMYEEAKIVRDQLERLGYITQPQMPIDFYMQNPNLYEDVRKKELSELSKILNSSFLILNSLHRIECFDIAHLAGSSPTASMVTFINGEADKTFYRHFKIKKAKGGDDYDSMREVAKRRMGHLGDWGKPDLIIVDGGAGQVKAFSSILLDNKVDIPVVGIAKNPDRLIVGDEKIRLSGAPLALVSRIRDEAHRFARRYHHKLVSRELIPK
ncbi:MAG: GIY-YIG nuclease family protein [Candidatus Woesebacteria bacterium]|nr:MAG: GIY-YIG nuclease family protein [Candidatus Woesebacteria bacterium]